MSLRISGNISSLYNTSRIGQTQDIDRTSRVEQQSPVSADLKDGRSNGSQYISQEHGGVVQTRVSDANAFKKAQLDTSREKIESMAEKLYDKLPEIFADMRKLPDGTEDRQAASRVSVNERNVAAVADKQAELQDQMMNFSL